MVELIYNWDLEDYDGGCNFGYFVYWVGDIYDVCECFQKFGVIINCLFCDGCMVFVCLLDGILVELL